GLREDLARGAGRGPRHALVLIALEVRRDLNVDADVRGSLAVADLPAGLQVGRSHFAPPSPSDTSQIEGDAFRDSQASLNSSDARCRLIVRPCGFVDAFQ